MADGQPLGRLLQEARQRLLAAGHPEAALDARLIVEALSGTDRATAISSPDRIIPAVTVAAIDSALSRRMTGEPVHRILGVREFYGLRLQLSEETLEPRPDTETLVDLVLPFVQDTVQAKGECRVLDLGTGTGAIALAILATVPQARAVATDLSEKALAIAASNADALGLADRITCVISDWFSAVSGAFDVILSNPPYIRSGDIKDLDRAVRDFDPVLALDGGRDGLDAYRRIAAGAAVHLATDAIVAVEIGAGQADGVSAIFEANGLPERRRAADLGGHIRALMFSPIVSR